jgi:acetyl esterase/lipase
MRPFLRLLALILATAPLGAQRAPFSVPLYAGAPPGAPLSRSASVFATPTATTPVALITHVQSPDVRVFLPSPARATGAAVVIYPGGGYRVVAIDHEGWQAARWLNSIGVAAIVCTYRVSDREDGAYRFPVPLLDARRAMRLTRDSAAAWRIDPARVGVMGFSAGGHLASMMLTMGVDTLPGETPAESAAMRHVPAFGILVYPVISFHAPWAHRGSRNALLGDSVPDSIARRYSIELRVTSRTPPTLLIATQDDDGVPPQNAIAFYEALSLQHVPAELHIWERGGHGFGMRASGSAVTVVREWPGRVAAWIARRGF